MLQHLASKMEDSDGTCNNNSMENDSNSDFDENDVANQDANPKLADALSKVLRMTRKKTKSKRSIVLSKAKLYGINKQVKKETCGFEIQPNPDQEAPAHNEEDVKPDLIEDKKPLKKIGIPKHELINRGRIIPSVLDREKERHLARIATRGVVQLFNAVRQQQTTLQKQLSEKKLTETKREKILKSVDRKAFLNALSGTVNISLSKDNDDDDDPVKTEIKEEEHDEDDVEKPSWEVLRNDFMMNAKLKDWDKKEEEEELSN